MTQKIQYETHKMGLTTQDIQHMAYNTEHTTQDTRHMTHDAGDEDRGSKTEEYIHRPYNI